MPGILITKSEERAQARVEQLQSRLERRAYELYEAEGSIPGRALEHWLEAERELTRPVPTQLMENDDGTLLLRAEVPGFGLRDLELDVGADCAVLYGTCHERDGRGRIFLDEFGGRVICRRIPLPCDRETGEVKAHLNRGVLDIRVLPAPEGRQGKKGTRHAR